MHSCAATYRGHGNTTCKALSVLGAYQVFYPDNSLEHYICLVIIVLVVHHTRAVNEEDALHECDVLPHLGLSWNWCNLANLHQDEVGDLLYASGTVQQTIAWQIQ